MGPAPIRGRQPGDPGTHSAGTNTERLFQDPMSALQINPRPSHAGTQSTGSGYAAVRTAVRTDRDTSVLARAAVGIMLTVAAMIVVAGAATQSAVAMLGGGVAVAGLVGALVALGRVPARPTHG